MQHKAYQYITNHDALNYTKGRQGNKIKYIVVHHWGEFGQTFENIIKWFCENPNCSTSAHYVVEAGKVACIVNPEDTAWHAGSWDYNTQSIGIECRPEAATNDYKTVARLVAEIWKQYGKLTIIGHRDVPGVPTACPGAWDTKIVKKIAEFYYNKDASGRTKEQTGEASDWAKEAWEWGKKSEITDGTNPQKTTTREEMITVMYRFGKLVGLIKK